MIVPGAASPMLNDGGFVFNAIISADTQNYKLRSAAIAAGWDGLTRLLARVTVNAGVYIGSSSTAGYAFDTGSPYPSGSTLALVNNGFIIGAGGLGGNGGNQYNGGPGGGGQGFNGGGASWSGGNNGGIPGTPGGAGGPAIIANYQLTVINNGTIGGGGGGGGGAGTGGAPGNTWSGGGSKTSAGAGSYYGGNGGSLGASGQSGYSGGGAGDGAGGPAGAAVIGNANITWSVTGTRLGPIS